MTHNKLLYIIIAILAVGIIVSFNVGRERGGADSASMYDAIYPPTGNMPVAPTAPIYPPANTPIYPPADPIYPPTGYIYPPTDPIYPPATTPTAPIYPPY